MVERTEQIFLDSNFTMGKVDNTIFMKIHENDLLIVQLYVNDLTFGSTNELLSKPFSKTMRYEF